MKDGVTLVALVAMVIIIFTILSVVLYNGRASVRLETLNDMYSDITTLEEKIQVYYISNSKVPTKGEAITFSADDTNPNDEEDEYYLINAGVLENIDLNNDINDYVVNASTLTVYYVDGYEYDGINYHTIPRTYAEIDLTGESLKEYQITYNNTITYNRVTYEGDLDGVTETYRGKKVLENLSTFRITSNRRTKTYYFKGWLGDDGKYYRYAYAGEPREVYAQWSKEKSDITVYFYNGTTYFTEREYTLGSTYDEFPDPPGSGKEFLGWANADGEIITEDMFVSANDTRLYAKWGGTLANAITITFDPLDGEVDTRTKLVEPGKTYGTLPVAVPNNSSYQFEGWYLDREFTNKITSDSIVNVNRNTTVYARYVRNTKYQVTFDFDRPDYVSEVTVREYTNGDTYGSLPTHNDVTTMEWVGWNYRRVTYEFKGWSTEEGGNVNVDEDDIVDLDGDITLYGVWERQSNGWW